MVGGFFYVHPLYLFVYMSAIAGQTAGPNELTFFSKIDFFFKFDIC